MTGRICRKGWYWVALNPASFGRLFQPEFVRKGTLREEGFGTAPLHMIHISLELEL